MDANAARRFRLTEPPPGFIDNPYPVYAALREHDPVHALGAGSYLLSRHADVEQVYRSPNVSSDKKREFAPRLGLDTPIYEHHTTSLVFSDPPLHTRVRRLLIGALNQRAITRMEAGLIALVERLLDQMADQAVPDLIRDFAAAIPVDVIGNLLAIPLADRSNLRDWSLAILSALEPAPSAEVLARANAATTDFLDLLRSLVADRRAHPGDPQADVLTRLIQGDGGESFSEAELLHNCIFLLNAGHETTSNLIGNGMFALLTHRDQLDRLAGDPALLTSAVEELLRFESPLQLNNRMTTCAQTLGGVDIAAGSFLTLAIGAANRDPAAFDKPDQLDVARKPNRHLAFGHGPHACAGMNVARLEARVAIGGLLARYPAIDLAETAGPERDQRLRFRGFRSLPVKLA